MLPSDGCSRTKAVADFLSVSTGTIAKWADSGAMPKPVYINGIKLFKNAEIHSWLSSQTTKY